VDALHGIGIPSEEMEADCELVRNRLKVKRELTAIINALKLRLLKHGVVLPKRFDHSSWPAEFRVWLGEQQLPTPLSQKEFDLLYYSRNMTMARSDTTSTS
jgi:hypothetical protein